MTRYREDAEAVAPWFQEFWDGYRQEAPHADHRLLRRFEKVIRANLKLALCV